ncbi:hypothetical protein Nepgr_009782 [Nepenthes gracilis]|uniref:Transglycosylase SLT domain-containing protein n=1 Tax=Nepenthes gracilis TaxID=150966 RepID=A0AAD3SBE0_NEPGR|nr:hypothetical protein Nepgr_009782 [Nepenthes gracilis]
MTVSFKYWDDCADTEDIEALWMDAEISTEWLDAGETRGQKVHLLRDPDGQPYLTQTEMRAAAEIIVRRHFDSQIDPDMICAIAELESDRQLLATRYLKKTKETTFGLMQISTKTADWLFRELEYRAYEVEGNPTLLYRPFVSIYLGAAYLKWLSNYDQKERSEEFVVRAFNGGTKKATHKTTLSYWRNYLSVKESLPSRKCFGDGPSVDQSSGSATIGTNTKGSELQSQDEGVSAADTYWDSRTSAEDMQEMWNHREVHKEWMKSGEKRGKVRFSHDEKKRPYLSLVELKAVAEIIMSKHFSTRAVKPTVLCAIAESVSMRLVNGVGPRVGLMGIDYPTADWLKKELGYRAYIVESADDLRKPFVSMYFGAAYMAWLSEYEGRERSPKFVVQAYLLGPKNVNLDEPGPAWLKFEEELARYGDMKREKGSCAIL